MSGEMNCKINSVRVFGTPALKDTPALQSSHTVASCRMSNILNYNTKN